MQAEQIADIVHTSFVHSINCTEARSRIVGAAHVTVIGVAEHVASTLILLLLPSTH